MSVVAFCGLAAISMLQDGGVLVPNWAVICFIVLAVSMYAGGVSPLPFVIMSEMFNFQVSIQTVEYVYVFTRL